MRGEGVLPGQLGNKAKAKTKGHRNRFAHTIIHDDLAALAATSSSRPRDACGAKVKVSSHTLDYDLDDAYGISAACQAIDAACGADVDHDIFDIDAACHAIDVACAFDIDAACLAIDMACAVKVNDAYDDSDSHGDGAVSNDTQCHINDAVVNVADDSKCVDNEPSHDENGQIYVAHDIGQAGSTTLGKAVNDGVIDDERDDHNHDVEHDDVSNAYENRLVNCDPACSNMMRCGPTIHESNDTEHDEISSITFVDDDNKSEISLVEIDGNSLSHDWYHVATVDADDWYLC